MCHDENSAVPLAPAPGGPVTGTVLELSTSDGNRYPAYLATPASAPTGPPIALPPDFVAEMRRPVLGLFGEADEVVPPDLARAFDEHLDTAGVAHEIVFYRDAPGQPCPFSPLWRRFG